MSPGSPSLEIRLLGPLELFRRGERLTLPPSRKARALLAYLAATGRAHGREQLCNLLWDGPADPRGALRGALTKIRPLLDGDHITRLSTANDRVQLQIADTRIDLAAAATAKAGDSPVELLESSLGLFRGEFLEGLELSNCYRFEMWCSTERESARRLRLTILSALIQRLEREPERALGHARDRLLLEPWAEHAHMDVMRLLAAAGRQAEAREQYERCRRILRTELGTVPSRELDELRRRMGPGRAAAPPARRPGPPDERRAIPPLAGRQPERETIRKLVKAAARRSPARPLLLIGEAGIGKTRLLDETSRLVMQHDGEVLRGRAFEAEMIRPYGAWIDALRDIPAEEVPVELRPELAPLLPELAPPPNEPADRNRLFEAVARLLATRAEARSPVALLLDDVQWIDEPSAALLHYLAIGVMQRGVMFACAARVSELDDNPSAVRVLRALRRDGGMTQLDLAPLNEGETASLLEGVSLSSDAERIFARSEGNPLFALELACAEVVGDALPTTIEELIEERLARLSAGARALLAWAAALGRDFSLDTLAKIAESPDPELLLALEELERRGVLQPRGARYDFIHDLVREIAYRRISRPRQRLIHGRIARVLDELDDPGHELASEVAHHAILGGEKELAARACLAAARRALWAFAPDEAAELAARGISQLEGIRLQARLSLHLELLALFVYPGMKQHRMPQLESLISGIIAEALGRGLQAQVHRGFQLIADIHYLDGDFSGALRTSLRAQEAGRAADPETVVRAIGDTARCLGIIERDSARAARLAREADALASGIGYEGHELPQALGYVHHHAGQLDLATQAFERAACLARNEHARWFECRCLARLVMIELERGRAEKSLSRCGEYLEVARKLDEGSDAPFAEALESVARLRLGKKDAASSLDFALERLRQVDSRWMIAYVQNLAGELELDSSLLSAASVRVREALDSAQIVDRRNEVAVARALLSRICLESNDRQGAAAQLEFLKESPAAAQSLSARARSAIDAASNALDSEPNR